MAFVDYTSFLKTQSFTTDISVNFPNHDHNHFEPLTVDQQHCLSSMGIPSPETLIFPKQIHTDIIWCVTLKDVALRGLFQADAVVTNVAGLPIAVRTADCLPVLIHDPKKKVVAAVHAGWKSAYLHIIEKTIKVMHQQYGCSYQDMLFAIGPCIRRDQYPVGEEFKQYFPQDVVASQQGFLLDLSQACHRQILDMGIDKQHIWDCGLCTFNETERFFSFRRQKEQSGRMLNLVVLS